MIYEGYPAKALLLLRGAITKRQLFHEDGYTKALMRMTGVCNWDGFSLIHPLPLTAIPNPCSRSKYRRNNKLWVSVAKNHERDDPGNRGVVKGY